MTPATTPPPDLTALLDLGLAEAPAIGALDQAPLRYGALRELVTRTRGELRRAGVGRDDRVALVLPNGPEMAAAFVAVAASATTAPLNPAYTADELDFYLSDLAPRALILPRGFASPARQVASRRSIPVLALEATGAAAGDFR